MNADSRRKVTREEYLAIEKLSETRNELVSGNILAMAGNTCPHVMIADNLLLELNGQLRGKSCRMFSSDLKVKVGLTEDYFYPDLVGVCRPLQFEPPDQLALLNPTVIIEVLSPSTEGYDRGQKFLHYQQIPSLKEYVLVAQDDARVELYTRGEKAEWIYGMISGLNAIATLNSIGCTVALTDIYRDVTFEKAAE